MSEGDDTDTTNDADNDYINGVDPSELTDTGSQTLSLTPEQHEQLKNSLHGDLLKEIKRTDRRYLVIGQGGGDPGKRRQKVCDMLDNRPSAIAFRLEDFGLTGDEIELWAPAFEILSGMVTHIVGVLEDFDGGHVWELGYLYQYQRSVRDILWLLKRIYEDEEVQREKYDNGMAASHLAALEESVDDRVIPWREPDDLWEAVEEIA